MQRKLSGTHAVTTRGPGPQHVGPTGGFAGAYENRPQSGQPHGVRSSLIQDPAKWATGGTIYDDVVSGTSASTGTLTETKIGTDTRTGSSTSTGTLVEARVATDTRTGSSTATGTLTETRVATDTVQGTSTAAHTISEAAVLAQTVAGTTSSTRSLAELHIHTAAPAGTSTSTGAPGEEHAAPPPPVATAPSSGLVAALTPRPRPKRPRHTLVYDDRPTGTSTSVGSLTEVHIPPTPTSRSRTTDLAVPDRDLDRGDAELFEQLLALELV